MECLLHAGAAVDSKDFASRTVLHLASKNGRSLDDSSRYLSTDYNLAGHLKVVERLLQAGAVVDARTDEGETSLYITSLDGAASTNSPQI